MSHFKPVLIQSQVLHGAAALVRLRRWRFSSAGAAVSASLVLLACGGVADLQLGQDSSALQDTDDGQPGSAAPSAGTDPATGDAAPVPGTPVVTPVPGTVPGQVYLVDPATGQLFLPCEVPLPTGVATDPPVPAEPQTQAPVPPDAPVPSDPQTPPAAGAEPWVQAVPPSEVEAEPEEPWQESAPQPGSAAPVSAQPGIPAGTGQAGGAWQQPVPGTGEGVAVSVEPCTPVGIAVPIATPTPGEPQQPVSVPVAEDEPVAPVDPSED